MLAKQTTTPTARQITRGTQTRGVIGFARYIVRRFLTVAFMVVCAVYIAIFVTNMGGYVDELIRANIQQQTMGMGLAGLFNGLSASEREQLLDETVARLEEEAGLNEPFFGRTLQWLVKGLTFDWGHSPTGLGFDRRTREDLTIRQLVAENMGRTLLIFGTANLLLFMLSIAFGLLLVRVQGSWIDKLLVLLSSLSAAPAWVYGVLLTVVLLRLFGFSAGGTLTDIPDEFNWRSIRVVLRVLTLPLLAILLSGIFQGIYTWRAFFQTYANEEYVTMGKAKGLPNAMLERRYIIRPALPAMLTSIALLMMAFWQEIIALEYFFNVEGIGRLLILAIKRFDIPVVVALVVLFAYLLGITVFLLDIVYALVDPRIRVAGNGRVQTANRQKLRLPSMPHPRNILQGMRDTGGGLIDGLQHLWSELKRYPTALFGLSVILLLTAVSIITVIRIPYSVALEQWIVQDDRWLRNPRAAYPSWVNLFRVNDLPRSQILTSDSPNAEKHRETLSATSEEITLIYPFTLSSRQFPQDFILDFYPVYDEKAPYAELTLFTPDQREINMGALTIDGDNRIFYASRDSRLKRRLRSDVPHEALFADPTSTDEPTALPGDYVLEMSFVFFEPDSDIEATVSFVGDVYGFAGTDSRGRDMTIALLWGTPVALTFGLLAAVITTLFAMIVAALGAWYGGWIDATIQLFTGVNLILPFYPLALLVFIIYSKSILAILAVTVVLNLFNDSIKVYRAAFLQFKESPYVEAAQAYGASGWRIASHYLTPRIIGLILPRLVIIVPAYVFLEATLAFLGVSDPRLPTWGKLIVAAMDGGVYNKATHLVLVPLGVIFLTSFAFALLARAIEDIYRPE